MRLWTTPYAIEAVLTMCAAAPAGIQTISAFALNSFCPKVSRATMLSKLRSVHPEVMRFGQKSVAFKMSGVRPQRNTSVLIMVV